MDGAGAVRLDSVRKRFSRRGRWVLDGVDLVADAGTVTVVAGGNGSGKSTLLRIAAGASEPTAGRVAARPRPVGYVPERLPARIRMTAEQYVAHMGRIRGLDADAVAARSRALFDRLALSPGPDVPIGSLSKGNSQKVALAQALLAPMGLLVLDDPYSGLDAEAREELTGLLDEARDEGTAGRCCGPIPSPARTPRVTDDRGRRPVIVGLIRYLAADALRAQRWMAPVLCFLAVTSVINAGGGPALSIYAATSTALLPVALWLTIVVVNSEDPIQTAITIATAGSYVRVQLAKLAAAYLACGPLALVALGWPLVGDRSLTATALAAGTAAHLLTALAGVAFGALLARPVVRRTAWTVFAGVAVCLAEILIPHFPPARQLLTLLGRDHPHHLAVPLALTAVQVVALSVVIIVAAHRLARDRV